MTAPRVSREANASEMTWSVRSGMSLPMRTAFSMPSAKDRTKAIMEAAGQPNNPSELCRATVKMLASILASEGGNLALKVLATGGVYLAGGVALHMLGALKEPQFMQAFARKGRFKDLMGHIPVHVITARAALVGAASFGLETYKHEYGVAA